MPRRPAPPRNRANPPSRTGRVAEPGRSPRAGDRASQLVELCDHCTSAQRIADAQGEKLLAYLLAMAIQEGQTALRRLAAAQAATASD